VGWLKPVAQSNPKDASPLLEFDTALTPLEEILPHQQNARLPPPAAAGNAKDGVSPTMERLRLTLAAQIVVVRGQIVEARRLHTLMRDTPKAATISANPLAVLKPVQLLRHMRSPLLGLATGPATEGSNVPFNT
jgi:hypothetical protein